MLKYRYSIMVPSINLSGQNIDHDSAVKDALKTMSAVCGGATAIGGIGSWVSDSGELITESVTSVYSYSESDVSDRLLDYALGSLYVWNQEAIALETPMGLELLGR